MAVYVNESKNSSAFVNRGKTSTNPSWDEAEFTWDEAQGTWDTPLNAYANQTKNVSSFANENKN